VNNQSHFISVGEVSPVGAVIITVAVTLTGPLRMTDRPSAHGPTLLKPKRTQTPGERPGLRKRTTSGQVCLTRISAGRVCHRLDFAMLAQLFVRLLLNS